LILCSIVRTSAAAGRTSVWTAMAPES
jgi:hypothetical protein